MAVILATAWKLCAPSATTRCTLRTKLKQNTPHSSQFEGSHSFTLYKPVTLRATYLDVCQLVEVCGKEAGGLDVAHDVLSNGPGQSKAVVGGCAAAQLVDDDQ